MKTTGSQKLKQYKHINLGIFLILCSVMGMINLGYVSQSITTAITFLFGVIGYWVIYPVMIAIGSFFIFKDKIQKKHILARIGAMLMIFGSLIFTTWYLYQNEVTALTISSFNNEYIDGFSTVFIKKDFINYLAVDIFRYNPLAGGYIGYMLTGLLNTVFTPIVAIVVGISITVIGFVFVAISPIKALIGGTRSRKTPKQVEDELEQDSVFATIDNGKNESSQSRLSRNERQVFAKKQVIESEPIYKEVPLTDNEKDVVSTSKNLYYFVDNSKKNVSDQSLQRASLTNQAKLIHTREEEVEEHLSTHEVKKASLNNNIIEPTPQIKEEVIIKEETPIIQKTNVIFKEKVIESRVEDVRDYSNQQIVPEEKVEIIQKPTIKFEQPKIVENKVENAPVVEPKPKKLTKNKYVLPSKNLLETYELGDSYAINNSSCKTRWKTLENVFASFGLAIDVINYVIGPSVTRFEIQARPGFSINDINKYLNDIAISLNGAKINFTPVIYGKDCSGLEIQNEKSITVGFKETIENCPNDSNKKMLIPFGKDISGNFHYGPFNKFPHLLIAGGSGSGKSIYLHNIVMSLLMNWRPDELKIVLVDPKRVEFSLYSQIPHLLTPIIKEAQPAKMCLDKLVREMDERSIIFEKARRRDIGEYNQLQTEKGEPPMPYYIVIVDEFGELLAQNKSINEPLTSLGARARSVGIHLILATQKPVAKILDSAIKTNLSTRVCFSVSSTADSVNVLNTTGAEKLIGQGDMLVDCSATFRSGIHRLQACYVSTKEIDRVTNFICEQQMAEFDPYWANLEPPKDTISESKPTLNKFEMKAQSDAMLYEHIKSEIRSMKFISISKIQRSYAVGFNRAGILFNKLVEEGLVEREGTSQGCRVLINNSSSGFFDPNNLGEDDPNSGYGM